MMGSCSLKTASTSRPSTYAKSPWPERSWPPGRVLDDLIWRLRHAHLALLLDEPQLPSQSQPGAWTGQMPSE